MTWIGSRTHKRPATAEPASAPASLEFPVSVSARGIAPASAVLEHLTANECRFRTVVFFDPGDGVEFAYATSSGQIFVRGSVVARTTSGPRFLYRMRLDRMSSKELDALARAVNENHRRAASRNFAQSLNAVPTTDRLTRASVRVVTQFPLVYRTPKDGFRNAKAGNVSSGGLLMSCADVLVEGLPVELRFTLPSDVLRVFPEETAVLDLRNARIDYSPTDPRRPFEEMVVGARVVTGREAGGGGYRYGLAFTAIDGYQQEEIARYTHAVQRSRNRH
ncbi:MAG TPA: PilZ domain-containing protein [Candidatus Acidoferrales bacterium]|nr:PilZ domain-containing protein [Candidatus Acidoferrales bacterium]